MFHVLHQETAYSRSFPGLKTCYVMSEIDVVVNNPKQARCEAEILVMWQVSIMRTAGLLGLPRSP
eukprot:3127272-Amphidinium_carterae.1